ncbi:MAG: FkbM family methyltransferase [Actinomadura sp.]
MTCGDSGRRELVRSIRDRSLRHVPGLQRLLSAGARRRLLPPALWRRLHPFGSWTLHAPDGTPFTYTCARHDGLARHVVWTDMRDWEATTQPVLYGLARRAAVFVDVGAYSGLYTVLACTANPALRAVAFEPNPAKLAQLMANMAANGLLDRVTIVGAALADRSGRAMLAIPSDDSAATLRGPGHGDRTVEITVTTGDAALSDLPVDLVKIDVEGAEPEVLDGMASTLAARRPKLIAECLDRAALTRLREVAAGHGYRYAYHLGRAGPAPVGDGFVAPRGLPNYLFTARPAVSG